MKEVRYFTILLVLRFHLFSLQFKALMKQSNLSRSRNTCYELMHYSLENYACLKYNSSQNTFNFCKRPVQGSGCFALSFVICTGYSLHQALKYFF
jgi:hypothetical protein